MKSNYKRLGDYIRQVDVRNKDEKVTRLLGVSIDKKFIESIANTIGTDMSVYKIVKHRQFAYGPVTSRNGDKVSIALLTEAECIISSSYTVFEVTDTKKLLPEYLNLWFKRPEFDRYARFHSHGSAREIFDWEEMCNVELPVPPIEEQEKIVDAYQKIETRIALKKKINENLEVRALTILKDFLLSANKVKLLDVIKDSCTGGDAIQKVPIVNYDTGIRCARVGDITNQRQWSLWGFCNANKTILETYKLSKYDILVTRTATLGAVQLIVEDKKPLVFNNGLIRLVIDSTRANALYVYWVLKTKDFNDYIHQIDFATSVRPNMKMNYLLEYDMPIISMRQQSLFVKYIEPLTMQTYNNNSEINMLRELKAMLLTTLSH